MHPIYWIGIKESDLDDEPELFEKSITFFGSGKGRNVSYSNESGKRINHNLGSEESSLFIAKNINEILSQNDNARFMYFSPYHSYCLPENLYGNVYCQNEKSILELLRNKINTRFWCAHSIPIVPSVLLESSRCFYEFISKTFGNEHSKYVLQKNYSAGGYSTYLLDKNSQMSFDDNDILLVSPYIEESVPLNVTAIIYEDDILLFPPSIQIIVNDSNRLLYKGADFIAYKELNKSIKQKVLQYSKVICENLKNIGYRGICGIDYITDMNEVFFMEINERFQASSYLINIALKKNHFPSLQQLCLEAFQKTKSNITLSEFEVDYSSYIYTYHQRFHHCYQYIFTKAQNNKNIVRIVEDGFSQNTVFEEDAYLFTLISDINIISIGYDNSINIDDNIREHLQLQQCDVLKTKISLMNQGFSITAPAMQYMEQSKNARTAINTGIDLILFGKIRVSSVWGKGRFNSMSPFELVYDQTDGLILTHYGTTVSTANYDTPDLLQDKYTSSGVSYSQIAFLANGRLQINHEPICFYKKHDISCRFCGLSEKETHFGLQDIYEVINTYIEHGNFNSFLIGGASNVYTKGWEIIINIAAYISAHSEKSIYLMAPPPHERGILHQLKQSGITEVSFNIEMFDRKIAKELMPGKGMIPLDLYYSMLEESTLLWGKTGKVRSMVIVGLESTKSLLEGIEHIAQIGVQPILSPFGPREDTELKNMVPFSSEKLLELFRKCSEICNQYGLTPGPDNIECQNNTLSIPKEYYV